MTKYGTDFDETVQTIMKKRLGKKLFGIGVPGYAFLGGAEFGYAVGLISYSIYHRYQYISSQMVQQGFWDESQWNPQYYKKYYKKYVIKWLWNVPLDTLSKTFYSIPCFNLGIDHFTLLKWGIHFWNWISSSSSSF